MKLLQILKSSYLDVDDIRLIISCSDTEDDQEQSTTNINDVAVKIMETAKNEKRYYPLYSDKNKLRTLIILKNDQVFGSALKAYTLKAKVDEINKENDATEKRTARKGRKRTT